MRRFARMRPSRIRWPVFALAALVVGVAIDVVLVAYHWPFTRSSLIHSLSQEAEGEVTIRDFHQHFFPHPGCTAHGVVIHHGPDTSTPPLITVDRLSVKGEYADLLRFSNTVQEIRAEGMHIRIPRKRGTSPHRTDNDESTLKVVIRRFIAVGTVLEFAPKDPRGEPFTIQIHQAVLSPASATAAMSFETSLRIPEPPGEVQAKGYFGPWYRKDPYQTPVSGTYKFEHADLSRFSGLAGTLASTGRFEGRVARLDVKGECDLPDFEIRAASQRLHLSVGYAATVDGQTGDVNLHRVDARFLRTTVASEGAIASPVPGDPKSVTLNMEVAGGFRTCSAS